MSRQAISPHRHSWSDVGLYLRSTGTPGEEGPQYWTHYCQIDPCRAVKFDEAEVLALVERLGLRVRVVEKRAKLCPDCAGTGQAGACVRCEGTGGVYAPDDPLRLLSSETEGRLVAWRAKLEEERALLKRGGMRDDLVTGVLNDAQPVGDYAEQLIGALAVLDLLIEGEVPVART